MSIHSTENSTLDSLVRSLLGPLTSDTLDAMVIDERLLAERGDTVSRAVFSMALNSVLFADLLKRVPTGAAYVADRRAAGERILFDHGAMRTVRFPRAFTGELPPGESAYRRILEPLGYRLGGIYPLNHLRMTGRSYTHQDFPEGIAQFFVSELEVERFTPAFAEVAGRVFGTSRDPLGTSALQLLRQFEAGESVHLTLAIAALPQIVSAFARLHDLPSLEDYQALLRESAEAAWIATEGQVLNHVTDRVPDVYATAEAQRQLGRPIKDAVEVSRSGRVRQTAFRADLVQRTLMTPQGPVSMQVPGSFYEFITRQNAVAEQRARTLDLGFDSANAQGIFKMTAAVA